MILTTAMDSGWVGGWVDGLSHFKYIISALKYVLCNSTVTTFLN